MVKEKLSEKRARLKAQIHEIGSIDALLLVEYIDMRMDEHQSRYDEVLNAYRTIKWIGMTISWLAALGASIALIISQLRGGAPPHS